MLLTENFPKSISFAVSINYNKNAVERILAFFGIVDQVAPGKVLWNRTF